MGYCITVLLLRVNPFNQPNVSEAKAHTSTILSSYIGNKVHNPKPAFEDSDYVIYSSQNISSILEFLKLKVSYFAILAYLDKDGDSEISKIRELIAFRVKQPQPLAGVLDICIQLGKFIKVGNKMVHLL